MDFEFDPEKLQADTEELNRQKRLLAIMGGVGDTLASSNSFGNFFTGKMNGPSSAVSKTAGAVSDTLVNPIDQQAKMFSAYKQSQDANQLKDQAALLAQKKDPNSASSKSLKQIAGRWGIQVTPEMSAFDIEQLIDPKKMMETEASANVEFNKQRALRDADFRNQKQLKGMEIQAEATKHARNEAEKRQAEQVKNSKLSERQVDAITALDDAEADIDNISAMLGNNSGWVGPVDGIIPNIAVGEDQVAFRSAIGKYKDAYRKAVTGAGASNTEIARLESRLPSETDTHKNFLAKAAEAKKDIQRKRNALLGNFEKSGKAVADYRKAEKTIVNRQINQKTGETRIVYSDGSTEIVPKTMTAGR